MHFNLLSIAKLAQNFYKMFKKVTYISYAIKAILKLELTHKYHNFYALFILRLYVTFTVYCFEIA